MSALSPYVLPILYFLGSLLVAVIGRQRKWGFWGYFWASLLMSPILGALFVLAGDPLPRRRAPAATPVPAPAAPAPAPRPTVAHAATAAPAPASTPGAAPAELPPAAS